MKAVTYRAYGGVDVIQIVELPRPSPLADEVLVRVLQSVVTPPDIAFRSGKPFIVRFFEGLTKPKHVAGTDFVGVVEQIGADVSEFAVGDRVFGSTTVSGGAHAEFVVVKASGVIATLPNDMPFEGVAGACDGGLTAYIFLTEVVRLTRGQKILINGASGCVGSYAVQIARHFGAQVTAVCSGKNAELVRSWGAHEVVDYTRQDFRASNEHYDVVFDAIGKSSFQQCRAVLTPTGVYMTTVPTFGVLFAMLGNFLRRGPRAHFAATGLRYDKPRLLAFKGLLEQGEVRAHVGHRYSLDEIVHAHTTVEAGHKRGSLLLDIGVA